MELIDNYNKALNQLLIHIGYKSKDRLSIVDCSMFYWHLAEGGIVYDRRNPVTEDSYWSLFVAKGYYDKRVFGGTKLTGIITGKIGSEVLEIFDNSKYVGNAKVEKIYL